MDEVSYVTTPDGKFVCEKCDWKGVEKRLFRRHLKVKHLVPQPDIEHRERLWLYALSKKSVGAENIAAQIVKDQVAGLQITYENVDSEVGGGNGGGESSAATLTIGAKVNGADAATLQIGGAIHSLLVLSKCLFHF